MLPKNIRELKQEAKKNCAAMKRVMKKMDDYLGSNDMVRVKKLQGEIK